MPAPKKPSAYQQRLFNHLPLYTTRLVRETTFTFSARPQMTAPEDVAEILREYYADRDREEFLIVLLDDQGRNFV